MTTLAADHPSPAPLTHPAPTRHPATLVLAIIAGTALLRLVFAAAQGLGVDESYMVAAGRTLQTGYFDHPPAAWWLAWAAANLAGTDTPLVVRLPFILLFALSTWLMARLATRLDSPTAGLWSAAVLNAAPVFGITTGTWLLPDGPLLAALLGFAVCATEALDAEGRRAWIWWLATGLCAGLALASKYTAILTLAGLGLFLLTQPAARRWLLRPQPWVAAAVAALVFSPVLLWNAQHGWISFLFQAGRAGSGHLRPWGPLLTLAGSALFLLPWIWAGLVLCGATALRRGPGHSQSWLLLCLAAPTILVFLIVSLQSRILFHWPAPGWLFLIPLLGQAIAQRWATSRALRRASLATIGILALGMTAVIGQARVNWLASLTTTDPAVDIEGVDWTSVRADLAARGLLDGNLVVAATRWHDAGKIDYALGGAVPVICLGPDPRQYGLVAPLTAYAGRDVLILAPRTTQDQLATKYGHLFDRLETLAPATVLHAGRPAMSIPLVLGRTFRPQG